MFSRVVVSFYVPTDNVRVIQFLSVLINIWCCLHFLNFSHLHSVVIAHCDFNVHFPKS